MESTFKQSDAGVIRIAIVGPESSGKTTLIKALAAHYKTTYAAEFMRTYFTEIAPRSPFRSYYKDLLPIAQGQIKVENSAAAKANKLLFCDTNFLEIACYANYYFDHCPTQILEASRQHAYNLTFLTYVDVPWEKDELRDRPNDRLKLFTIFEQALNEQHIPHTVLKGGHKDRLDKAVKTIDNYCRKLNGI